MASEVSYKAYVLNKHSADLSEEVRCSQLAELAPDEVMIKTRAAGVCHTDLHFWHGHYQIGRTDKQVVSFSERGITLPRVMGHEVAGDVYAMGSRALVESGFKVGDRVLLYPWVGCEKCVMCDAGEAHMCIGKSKEMGFLVDGAFTEYAKSPSYRYVFKLAENVSYELGAIIPCSALTAYNAVKKAQPVLEQVANEWKMVPVVGVIGLGGLGQWALKLLRCVYKDTTIQVIGIDISESKTTHILKESLVDQAFLLDTKQDYQNQAETFLSKFDNRKINVILDFVNTTDTFQLSICLLNKAGILVSVGLHGGLGEIQLPFLPLSAHTITGVYTGSVPSMKELLEVVNKFSLEPPSITYYPMCDVTKALHDLESGVIMGRAVLTANND